MKVPSIALPSGSSEPRPELPARRLIVTLFLAVLLGGGMALGVAQIGSLFVLGVLGAAFIVVALARPDLSVLAFTFVLYINLSDNLIALGYPSIAKLFVGLLAFIILVRWLVFKDEYRGVALPLGLAVLYTVAGSISLFAATDFNVAVTSLGIYLKDAVIFLLILLLIQNEATLGRAIWVMLVAGIFMGTLSVFQEATRTFGNTYYGFGRVIYDTAYGYRLGGAVHDPNFYAQIMVVLLPLAAVQFFSEKRLLLKAIAAWAFLVCALTVVFTFSRGAFLGVFALILLAVVRLRPRLALVSVGLFAVAVVYSLLPSNYVLRISTLLDFLPGSALSPAAVTTFRGRTSENLIALQMFLDYPVAGAGIGNYNNRYQEYSRLLGIDPRLGPQSAHSLYLEIAAERGVLGLIAFALLIYWTFRTLSATERKLRNMGRQSAASLCAAISMSMVGYLVTAIFLHDAFIRYFWLLLGIAWAVPQAIAPGEEAVEHSSDVPVT